MDFMNLLQPIDEAIEHIIDTYADKLYKSGFLFPPRFSTTEIALSLIIVAWKYHLDIPPTLGQAVDHFNIIARYFGLEKVSRATIFELELILLEGLNWDLHISY
ncbi:hypothetical protein TWF192_005766 [Orbilia oligospora]|uniref:Cyclin N-terminal domain-containing protein n=1 Tax=Orbilia oligospora TaxID=2813651 RepID=A0A6G1MMQ8_ORBOL|nr:hypothetical protein TWF191_003875 [Orbilia oligospora]KAF3263485.1 hypothetical protein TWF192_005766 [Orbilia oligospora]